MVDDTYKDTGHPLTHLQEECAELIKAICKAKRFGLYNHHPDFHPSVTNYVMIMREINDVEYCIEKFKNSINKIVAKEVEANG